MPLCEMCGKNANLVLAEIEGVDLKVCPNCSKHGKIKSSAQNYLFGFRRKQFKKEEVEETVVENFAQLIREAREKRGMKQEEFAKFLNERESQVAKWELGIIPLAIETAKKLQRVLGVTFVIVEEASGELKPEKSKPNSDVLTLGDFIKIKKMKYS